MRPGHWGGPWHRTRLCGMRWTRCQAGQVHNAWPIFRRWNQDSLVAQMQPMTNDLPTGTVTFLFTDIEGSTPLWEREPDRVRPALERHNAILRQAVTAHNGALYKMIGDAIQAAFALPADGLAAALAAQRELEA